MTTTRFNGIVELLHYFDLTAMLLTIASATSTATTLLASVTCCYPKDEMTLTIAALKTLTSSRPRTYERTSWLIN